MVLQDFDGWELRYEAYANKSPNIDQIHNSERIDHIEVWLSEQSQDHS